MNDFNTSIRSILLIAIVAVSARSHLGSQIKSPPSTRHKSLSADTTCYDEATGKFVGSRMSHTSMLVSPDGGFRAYAESGAVAGELPTTPECRNTSKLFVAGRSQSFHIVLTIEPSAEALGNSIEIIDWSPTEHRLLQAHGFWQYGSDVGGNLVRIYDADSDNLSSERLVDDAFSRYVGKKCAVILRPLSSAIRRLRRRQSGGGFMCSKTRSLAVEFRHSGRPSTGWQLHAATLRKNCSLTLTRLFHLYE